MLGILNYVLLLLSSGLSHYFFSDSRHFPHPSHSTKNQKRRPGSKHLGIDARYTASPYYVDEKMVKILKENRNRPARVAPKCGCLRELSPCTFRDFRTDARSTVSHYVIIEPLIRIEKKWKIDSHWSQLCLGVRMLTRNITMNLQKPRK